MEIPEFFYAYFIALFIGAVIVPLILQLYFCYCDWVDKKFGGKN